MNWNNIIALDDWAIYATDPETGELTVAWSECWPDWLSYFTAPEDMSDEDFKLATLRIMHNREVRGVATEFVKYRDWFVEGEKEWALFHGKPWGDKELGEAHVDATEAICSILTMAMRQSSQLLKLKAQLLKSCLPVPDRFLSPR